MKRLLFAIGIIAMAMIVSSPAWSIPYTVNNGETNVGELDTLLEAGKINSGDQNEIDWVNSVLVAKGYISPDNLYTVSDLTKYDKDTIDMNMIWQPTNDFRIGVWAIDFQTTPEYFYIKTGSIESGAYAGLDHFLYRNETELAWGVINLRTLGIEAENIGKISHVGELGDVQVPEPTGILLLGLGLVGIASVRRFKR